MNRIEKMKYISLLLLIIFSTSCIPSPEEESEFPGNRRQMRDKKPRGLITSKVDDKPVNNLTTQVLVQNTTPSDQNKPEGLDQNTTPSHTLNTEQEDTPLREDFIFPFRLTNKHSSLILKSSDHEKISFSVKPETEPLALIAGFDGKVSLKKNNGIIYLSLTPHNNTTNQVFYFELNEKESLVEVEDKSSVSEGQVLMLSPKAITWYVEENEQISVLCINTSQLEKVIEVVKELPKTEQCS